MINNLKRLAERVDRSTIDRKLADRIQTCRVEIGKEIKLRGFSVVEVDGKKFRVMANMVKNEVR